MSNPALVEQTWAMAAKIDGFTETFYDRLFTIKPDYKTTLFGRTNIKAQSKMLASMIGTAVDNLRNPDVLVPALQDLGMRHCRYGCRKEHYGPVGEALLWTIQFYLKDKFTPEVKAAWVDVYTTIVTVMTSQLDTAEGQRLLAEYEARYPSPKKDSGSCCGSWAVPAAVAIGVVAVAGFLYMRRK
jgi:hemoglobin-like flavoprotein